MNLLAVDSSSRTTVLGLLVGDQLIDSTSEAVNSHSREILPSIQSLLGETGLSPSQLDGIVFGCGPGSFTGLRISVGVVQGLCYGLDIPAVSVSSMACLAQQFSATGQVSRVFVALTARLEEIYYGSYHFDSGCAVQAAPEGVLDVSELPVLDHPDAGWAVTGNALALTSKIEASTGVQFAQAVEQSTPSLEHLMHLGRTLFEQGQVVDALQVSPVYLREEVASRPGSSP